ncbi:MAG: MATE family efflux transporter [Spirochaetales bacterium]|nr:MATE family efflux transporter [Spirochaetales bacterium]
MASRNDFASPDITKTLLKYSFPTIIITTVQALYSIVDRIYIGKGLGTDALAGVTLTFPIFILTIAMGTLFGQGSGAVISLKLGEGKKAEAEKALGTTFVLYFLLGSAVAVTGVVLLDPILRLFGATKVTLPYARRYLAVYLPFMAVDFMAMGTNGTIRSEGSPRLAMVIAVSGTVLNMLLDPLFLFVFKWGVTGVAWATVICRIFTAAVVLYHFARGKRRYLNLKRRNLRINLPLAKKMMAIGTAPFLFNAATALGGIFHNRMLVAYGGDRALGAWGVVMSVYMVILTPVRGVQFGSQPLMGYNYGAGKYDRVGKIHVRTCLLAVSMSLVGVAVVHLFGQGLAGFFSRGDGELVAMGSRALVIYTSMMPFMAIQLISVVYFQSVGKPLQAILLNLGQSTLYFLIPLFLLPLFWGLDGVWAAAPVSHFLGGLTGILLVLPELRKLGGKSFFP